MMIFEMREAAYEKAFELFDEVKDLDKQKKMIMCELEDALYDCYEASKEGGREDEEVSFRRAMRRHSTHDLELDDEDPKMYGYRSARGMRYAMRRRNRMGQFV